MPKIDIKEIEEKWKSYWQENKIFEFDPKSKKKIYSIDTPPPTVSGEMHMGHALMYSQMDFIARYKRMAGFEVFYPFGTDDNGLPTEKLVQKLKKVKSTKMEREDFIKLSLETLKEILPKFVQDWKDLAISCDYSKIYSTIDDESRKISQKSFIELYKKGEIYKEEFPTIWDTEFQTPVAQAELEDRESKTLFTTINFTSQGKNLPIATTRPEFLAACRAIFIHPKNEKYASFIGKKANVPLFDHEVPIIADESADPQKGTGILMVCSYGDKYDVEAIKKHKLEPKIILEKDGTLNIEPYKGLLVEDARKKVLQDLKEKDLIVEQKEILHVANVFEKSTRPIEFIPTEQWFIKILDKKEKLIKQGGKIKWLPSHMEKRYNNWVEGLEWDWSISRDRHFGIPIPAWYCPKCKETILADISQLPIDPTKTSKDCPKCKISAIPDKKVLDTWATSSMSPELATNLFDIELTQPFSLRPQGHDIIRTWAFYTIVKSLLHKNQIPWKNITITGMVNVKGEKMAKSKGNGVNPQEIMNRYGSDSLRYWSSSSKLGEDLEYQEKDIVTGEKFINKILNATNFVFMNLDEIPKEQPKLHETDRIFLVQLNNLIKSSTQTFDKYNYSKAKMQTDKFFWQVLADNYLEIVKNRIYNGNPEEKASASYALYHSLLTILKLMAPITPYITEEIYQTHFKSKEKDSSIHISHWPTPLKIKESAKDKETWDKLLEVISAARQAKSQAQVSMKNPIELTLPKEDQELLNILLDDLKSVTSTEEIKEGKLSIKVL